MLFLFNSAYAIDWQSLNSPSGKTIYLDKDSIKEYKGYYFYNIKYKNSTNNNYTVVTIQSAIKHPFSARIKFYPLLEYENLKGDYGNITLNMTKDLEAVTYNSVVNTCYLEVKRMVESKKKPTIILE